MPFSPPNLRFNGLGTSLFGDCTSSTARGAPVAVSGGVVRGDRVSPTPGCHGPGGGKGSWTLGRSILKTLNLPEKTLTIAASEWRFIGSQKDHRFTSCVRSLAFGGFSKMQKRGKWLDWGHTAHQRQNQGDSSFSTAQALPPVALALLQEKKGMDIWSAGLSPVAPPAPCPLLLGTPSKE